MNLDEALRKRINELVADLNISLTELCLKSNLTPSTIFDFMYVCHVRAYCIPAGTCRVPQRIARARKMHSGRPRKNLRAPGIHVKLQLMSSSGT